MTKENGLVSKNGSGVLNADLQKAQKTLEAGKTVIGIDIGISSVNIAQIASYQGNPIVIRTASEKIIAANERERDAATASALKTAMGAFNTRQAVIICVISGPQSVVESMVMPVMPADELKEAIELQVKGSQYFSSVETPVIDYRTVGYIHDKGIEKQLVLAAAAGTPALQKILANFFDISLSASPRSTGVEPLNLDVTAIIPACVALENLIRRSTFKKDEIIGILEVGTVSSELNIFRNLQIEFSRKIPVAGVDLTRSLTSALFTNAGKIELSMAEAEEIKRKYGIPAPGENFLINDKITSGQVLALLRPRLEQMAGETSRAFDYYNEKTQTGHIDRLLLIGGGAKLKGLSEFLNAELGIPVELANPLHGIPFLSERKLAPGDDSDRLVLAVGASLANPKEINLVPVQFRDLRKKAIEKMALTGAAIASVLFLVISYAGLHLQLNALKKETVSTRQQYAQLSPKLHELKSELLLKKTVKTRPDLGAVLRLMSRAPESMYLTKMEMADRRVKISGLMAGAEKSMQDAPSKFVLDLQKAGLTDATLLSTKKTPQRPKEIQFEIEGSFSR